LEDESRGSWNPGKSKKYAGEFFEADAEVMLQGTVLVEAVEVEEEVR